MEFVYATFAGLVLYAPTGNVSMEVGEVWFADDPFVAARPDLFSSAPPVVRSTVFRAAPDTPPLPAALRRRRG